MKHFKKQYVTNTMNKRKERKKKKKLSVVWLNVQSANLFFHVVAEFSYIYLEKLFLIS